jgi:pimeloyl-ACP methyl ester carboxylesterase
VLRVDPATVQLPPSVAVALSAPGEGVTSTLEASGRPWSCLAWGRPSEPPLLLVHGVTSNARVWWRVGPALAASGRRVLAVDLPGHGTNPAWQGRHRFVETAADLAAFIRAAGLETADLAVVGHSWGGIVTAHLPIVGIRPAVLVLLDPPAMTVDQLEAYSHDPTEGRYETLAEARAAVRAANPSWADGDVEAKAMALTEFDQAAVRDVLLRNGDFDAGMAALRDERAAGMNTWLIRGEEGAGGCIPEELVPEIERQLGAGRVITIPGAPHSPQRTHPEATTFAILRSLESG